MLIGTPPLVGPDTSKTTPAKREEEGDMNSYKTTIIERLPCGCELVPDNTSLASYPRWRYCQPHLMDALAGNRQATEATVGPTMTPTPTIRRYVSAAYTAMMRGQWDVASECFNRAHQECLVMASQPLSHVPAPGALAGDYLELANRATDPGAKEHWVRLAARAARAAEAAEAEDAEEAATAVPAEEEEAC